MGVARRARGFRAGVPKADARGSVRRVQRKRDPHIGLCNDHVEYAAGCRARQRSDFTPRQPPASRLGRQRVPAHYLRQEALDREGEPITCGIIARSRSGYQTSLGSTVMVYARNGELTLAETGWAPATDLLRVSR